VGRYIAHAERQYKHVSDCCQICALQLPTLLCLCMNFWPKNSDSLKENKTSLLNDESRTMAKHPEIQTMHFTGNGCAITGLIDPSPKETALMGQHQSTHRQNLFWCHFVYNKSHMGWPAILLRALLWKDSV